MTDVTSVAIGDNDPTFVADEHGGGHYQRAAWDCAHPYVRILLAAARLNGFPIELRDVRLEDDGTVRARWLIATPRAVNVDSDGWIEYSMDYYQLGVVPRGEQHVRRQLNAQTWPKIAAVVLQGLGV